MSEIRVNNIIDEAGTGAPTFPNGATGNLTGNVTGTSAGLTGTPNITVGTVGCGNVTSTGDVIGVNATFSGNLTVQGTTTTIDTAVTSVDSLSLDGDINLVDNGKIKLGVGTDLQIYHNGSQNLILSASGQVLETRADTFQVTNSGGTENLLQAIGDGAVNLYHNGDKKFETTADGVDISGTISDSMGLLRRLGINAHNAATYTLVAGDAGKLVREATNGANITIPQNVFSAGDMISIFNVSGGDNTITEGTGTTLYNTSDAATGNRTLGSKGVCTIVCTDTNEFIISGSQLS